MPSGRRGRNVNLLEYQLTWRLEKNVAHNTASYSKLQSFTCNCCANSTSLTNFTIGPLQLTVTWYKIHLAGEQIAHWEISNKASLSSHTWASRIKLDNFLIYTMIWFKRTHIWHYQLLQNKAKLLVLNSWWSCNRGKSNRRTLTRMAKMWPVTG